MKPQVIRFICSPERIKQILSGPGPILNPLGNEDFQIMYGDVDQLEGMELPENFPESISFFKNVYESSSDYFNKFPECCDSHRKLLTKNWFNKNDYLSLPDKVTRQLYFTIIVIGKAAKQEIQVKELIDYIEHNILSFGQLPAGYGSSVGLNQYLDALNYWLDWSKEISTELKEAINSFLNSYDIEEVEAVETDLVQLYNTYKKWISIFPLNIEYFKNERESLTKSFPLFSGAVQFNKFIGTIKGKAHTIESLSQSLLKMTTHLLGKIDTVDLLEKGLIEDLSKHKLDLVKETHRIKQVALLNEFSELEGQYVNLLANWLQNEKDYFLEIEPLFKVNEATPEVTEAEAIRAEICKFGFNDLPKVKILNSLQMDKLYLLISQKDLPFQLAMFNYLGFPDLLVSKYFNSKYEMYKFLARCINSGKNVRAIKGNLSVLNPKSTEDKSKYTAHLHKKTVEKEYQNIK